MTMGQANMKSIKVIGIILISLSIFYCGRPGGKDEENAPGSYLQVTSVTLSGNTVTITVKNTFKDTSVTTPNSLYDVTLTSYTLTYFRGDGSIILTSTQNNSIYIYIPVKGEAEDVPITLVPGPSSISYSSASVYLSGKNGFGNKIATTFYLPRLGGGIGTAAPTVTSVSPNSGSTGNSYTVYIYGTNFVSGATVTFGSGITVNSTSFVSSTQLTVNITIDSDASAGTRDVTVTNPDGQSGTGTGIFTVT